MGDILLVDNNKFDEKIMRSIIQSLEESVIVAHTVDAWKYQIENNEYDLVLVSRPMISLQKEVSRKIVLSKENYMPFVLLAEKEDEVYKKASLYGFTDRIMKPFQSKKVEAVITNQAKNKRLIDYYLKENGVDVVAGLGYSDKRYNEYNELVQIFINEYTDCRENMIQSKVDRDFKHLRIHAHSLKSNARGLGAGVLAQYAYVLEMGAKEMDDNIVNGTFNDVIEQWEKQIKLFNKYVKALQLAVDL